MADICDQLKHAQSDQSPVGEIVYAKHVNPLDLLHGPASGRWDLMLLALQGLAERCVLEDLGVWGSADAIELGFQIPRPLLCFDLAV